MKFASLILAGALFLGAPAHAAPRETDMVLVNGKIVTMDPQDRVAEAVAIRGGRIVAVGSNQDVSRLADGSTRRIDLHGRTVVPGLIDSHVHAVRDALFYSSKVDWSDAESLSDALARLRARAVATPPGAWIIVVGSWSPYQFPERRGPTPAELDAISADHPIFVQYEFEWAVLNRLALRTLAITQAGLTAQAPQQPLELERGADGSPTGVIIGHGFGESLRRLIAPALTPTAEEQIRSTEAFFHKLNGLGLTGIIDQADVPHGQYRPLFQLWRSDRLSLRVRYNLLPERTVTPPDTREGAEFGSIQEMTQFLPPGGGDDRLRFLGLGEALVSGLIDGALNSDPPLALRPEAVPEGLRLARWAAAQGYSLSVHASHAATADKILDIFEEVNRTIPIGPLRWRIEHGEDIGPAELARMKALGVAFSVQDRLYYGGDTFIRLRGAEVARRSPPIGTALRMGLKVMGGTDGTVITPPSPFVSLQWMLDGRTASGRPTRGSEEIPSRLEALSLYTRNGAWASFDEDKRGSIEPGKLADLVVLTDDYLTVPIQRIGAIKAELTILGGQVVYDRSVEKQPR